MTTFLAVGFFVLTFALAWSAKARNEASLELSLPQAPAPVETSELPESEAPAGRDRGASGSAVIYGNRLSRVLKSPSERLNTHPLAEVAELVDALA